jgi:kynureninase
MNAFDDPLLRFRGEFPILEKTIYLISNSLGAMPRAAEEALAEFACQWKTRSVRAWAEGWWDMPVAVGDEIAPLIGAAPGTVTMLPNVTTAQAVVLSCFDYRPPRNKIVMIEGEFPSVRYVYQGLATRLGARLAVVGSPAGDGLAVDEERLASAVDSETAVVVVSQVLFKNAYVVDLGPILDRAARAGAVVVVDGYQSVGTLPVSVSAAGIPILVGGVLKWLCGGPGGAFLYAAPEIRERLEPSFTGWFAHRRPFAFEDEMDRAPDARRFLLGTPSIPALFAAREGPRILRQAGIEAVREKSLRQTTRAMDLARRRGFSVPTPHDPHRRGGTVTFGIPNSLEISRELNARDICVDYRAGAGIRMSPHFYTRDDEIDRAFEEIDRIRADESWRRWRDRPAVVT